jgi:hypothetical protein
MLGQTSSGNGVIRTLDEVSGVLGVRPHAESIFATLSRLAETELRLRNALSAMLVYGPMGAVTRNDVARYVVAKTNLYTTQIVVRAELIDQLAPRVRGIQEPVADFLARRIPMPEMLPDYSGPVDNRGAAGSTFALYAAPPVAPAVAAGAGLASPALAWGAIVVGALLQVAALVAIAAAVSAVALSAGASIIAWVDAKREEAWWRFKGPRVDRCFRDAGGDLARARECVSILNGAFPQPTSQLSSFMRGEPFRAPWWLWVGGMAIAGVVGFGVYRRIGGSKVAGLPQPMSVSRPRALRVGRGTRVRSGGNLLVSGPSSMDDMIRAVRTYAREHYNQGGWDIVVEAFDNNDLRKIIDRENARTSQSAIAAVRKVVRLHASVREDIQREAF